MAKALAGQVADKRALARDEVHYRARAYGPDAQQVSLLIVNLSALGLMARAEVPYGEGDRLRVTLPVVGVVVAEIRWALGGRIGCELDQPIDLADYYEVLAVMVRGK
ncbi:MAG: PilZ domain-containing protein [Sphingomonas sp.]|uniref:PilZ domain-containing protein n=1 Tax=unclassified Sphingomonas TaxID=196159 RepID=UPI000F8951F6|nr:PilZ domain-containing protein [Sphingomonas sp. TF3]RUN77249.1 PilZ domain-containing protein [Sphingomonas sp. TF3]